MHQGVSSDYWLIDLSIKTFIQSPQTARFGPDYVTWPLIRQDQWAPASFFEMLTYGFHLDGCS